MTILVSSSLDEQINRDSLLLWGSRGKINHGKHVKLLQAEAWNWDMVI